MANLNKLAGKMREHRVTQKIVAEALSLTPQTISARMTGRSKFNTDEAEIISNLLQLTESEYRAIFFCGEVS